MALRLTFDHDCELIDLSGTNRDEYGNPVPAESRTRVQCYLRSATRTERANAGHLGYKAEHVLGVHSFEFSGEEKVELLGKRYDVLSSYILDNLITELTVGEKLGG